MVPVLGAYEIESCGFPIALKECICGWRAGLPMRRRTGGAGLDCYRDHSMALLACSPFGARPLGSPRATRQRATDIRLTPFRRHRAG